MAYVHRKFEDGKFYQCDEESPDVRLCCGLGGVCRVVLADEWHDPLCPACRFQVNANAVVEQGKRLGLI